MSHLPDCTTIAASDIARQHGDDNPEHFEGILIEQCVGGCPTLERSRERGRELAERFGW